MLRCVRLLNEHYSTWDETRKVALRTSIQQSEAVELKSMSVHPPPSRYFYDKNWTESLFIVPNNKQWHIRDIWPVPAAIVVPPSPPIQNSENSSTLTVAVDQEDIPKRAKRTTVTKPAQVPAPSPPRQPASKPPPQPRGRGKTGVRMVSLKRCHNLIFCETETQVTEKR
jgi:hypothetical protein